MPDHPEANWIVVLSDQGTYTGTMGTVIAFPTDEQMQELKEGSEPDEIDNVEAYDLHELVRWAHEQGYFETHKPVRQEGDDAPP